MMSGMRYKSSLRTNFLSSTPRLALAKSSIVALLPRGAPSLELSFPERSSGNPISVSLAVCRCAMGQLAQSLRPLAAGVSSVTGSQPTGTTHTIRVINGLRRKELCVLISRVSHPETIRRKLLHRFLILHGDRSHAMQPWSENYPLPPPDTGVYRPNGPDGQHATSIITRLPGADELDKFLHQYSSCCLITHASIYSPPTHSCPRF